jgi:phosphoribosylanthranilate isomerase
MPVSVKICGLTTPETCLAAAQAGAAYLGFMFYAPSPRALTINAAKALRPELPNGPARVGVFVNPDDALIDATIAALGLNWIQLHGHETPARITELKARTGLKVMKAIGVSTREDIEAAQIYYAAVDAMLFDAKPPKGAILPGGNAISFPWNILQDAPLPKTWLLAGGLKTNNLAEAAKVSHAKILDVSSGVEESPGVKSISAIKAFLNAAKAVR